VQKWSSDVTAMNADVAAHPSAPLVFIGDSITYRWQTIGASIWDSTWAPEGALDLRIGGDTTQNVLQRLDADKELGALHPAAAVVLIGTNDFHHGWSPAQVAFGITRVARTLQAKLPTTEIELVSLLPRSDSSVEAADVVATNAILDATHFGPRIAYNDFYPDFVTSTGAQVPGDFNPLGVHPTAQGYAEELSLLQAIPAVASA
jgi:lysophospholipase L1-like esterase